MKKKAVEILAPAGSFESMKAAVSAGADAVYIGGSRFGARAFADNPDEDLLLKAIDYVHLHGRRLYLTVNTLVKEEELKELYEYLLPYYKQGVDAVIVQDFGVFSVIRKCFPDLPVHASTQMTMTGVYGARLLKELGAERVVTARELSLEEIKRIHDEVDVEIESFVHGALCYSYSGQCLFSSLIGGRSGNRGRCAQTCRLPFDIKQEGKMLNNKDQRYCLSLKDLCTLDLIPDIVEAGVYSMKIEGRMKSPRYTAGVVELYRKYTDLYLEQGRTGYCVMEQDRRRLLDLFDRGGLTDGYYKRHNGRNMVVWKEKPGFREGNQELFQYLDKTFVEKERKEPASGTVLISEGKPAALTLKGWGQEVSVTGDTVLSAQNQPITEEKVKKQVEKTGNTPFFFENLEITIEGNSFLPLQALNDLRRKGLGALQEAVLKTYERQGAAEEAGGLFDKKEKSKGESADRVKAKAMKLSVSLERPDAFKAAVKCQEVWRIYLDAAEFGAEEWRAMVKSCHEAGKECMLTLPHIFRAEAEQYFNTNKELLEMAGFDGFLLRSIEEIGFLKKYRVKGKLIFDYGLYAMNNQGGKMLFSLGADELTWPVELNSRELGKLNFQGELVVYGRLPMMVTAQCIHKGTFKCDKKPQILTLRDRLLKEFPVKNHCRFCYNTIYNSEPLSLLGQEEQIGKLSPSSLRLQFTTEDGRETMEIIKWFGQAFLGGKKQSLPFKEFTRGHFKRGVE